jgi:hypothetical protein
LMLPSRSRIVQKLCVLRGRAFSSHFLSMVEHLKLKENMHIYDETYMQENW